MNCEFWQFTGCAQFEGAYLEDGKGWSIWDERTNNPGAVPREKRVYLNQTGTVLAYHKSLASKHIDTNGQLDSR